MILDILRTICLALPGTTEEIQWGDHLLFKVAGKMFCIGAMDGSGQVSFKVPDDVFDELSATPGYTPAPHLARAKWIQTDSRTVRTVQAWEAHLQTSYGLVRAKLPKKVQAAL